MATFERLEEQTKQYKKTRCRYCDSPLPESFLDLGFSPLANNLPKAEEKDVEEFQCPLRLVHCQVCHLVQLSHVVPPDMMFAHYLYVSSTTKTFQTHFAEYAKTAVSKLKSKQNALAVDIGSNDGLLVSFFIKEGIKGVGVEPAKNLAELSVRNGVPTINSYFGRETVQMITKEYGKASIVTANNVFAHIDDVQSVLRNVNDLLPDNGIFIIEFPYLMTMFEKMYFDMIYHEHLSYIGITALDYFTKRFGLQIFDIQPISSHGGSLRVFIQKTGGGREISETVTDYLKNESAHGISNEKNYREFSVKVANIKTEIMKMVREIKANGKSIAGYGAPAKATTIANYCGLTKEHIDYVVDDNSLKQGRLVPGCRIPIVSSAHLTEHPTDCILIFAWNFAEEIVKKMDPSIKAGKQFIVPLPKPKIIL